MLKSTSKASLRSFASSYADGPPFCKERLSFADGCVVFGAQICPKTTTADGGRPLSPQCLAFTGIDLTGLIK